MLKVIRILPLIISASGLIVLFFGLASYSGSSIPFHDAPPELLINQQNEIDFACFIMASGLCIASGGLAWLIYRHRKSALTRRSSGTPNGAP